MLQTLLLVGLFYFEFSFVLVLVVCVFILCFVQTSRDERAQIFNEQDGETNLIARGANK